MAAKKKNSSKKTVSSKTKASAKKATPKKAAKKVAPKKTAAQKPKKVSSVAKTLKKIVKKVTSVLRSKPATKAKPAARKAAISKKEVNVKKSEKKPIVKKPKTKNPVTSISNTPTQTPIKKKEKAMKKPEPEKTRYSDAELEEFRQLINQKLAAAREELKYLQEQITRTTEIGDTEADTTFSGLEDGTSTMEREYLNQMASRQITYINHLEKALIRIENKTYGICRETGKLIPKERLRAVPHATLSIEAKMAKD
jgi:RNA polymerase-binding transcription factor DksA